MVKIPDAAPLEPGPKSVLAAWRRVYEGLSEEDLAEVEAIALDRGRKEGNSAKEGNERG